METIITIFIILATGYLFVYAFKYNIALQKNNIIKNLEIYAEKEKAKQQESKILGQKPIKRTTNKKEKTNV